MVLYHFQIMDRWELNHLKWSHVPAVGTGFPVSCLAFYVQEGYSGFPGIIVLLPRWQEWKCQTNEVLDRENKQCHFQVALLVLASHKLA